MKVTRKILTVILTFAIILGLTVQSFADQTEGKGLVWVVSDDDTTIYLLGTVHIGSEIIHPFNQRLLNIIPGCDAVIFEADFGNIEGIMYMIESFTYKDGDKLSNHISEELFAELLAVFADYPEFEILDKETLEIFTPFALASTFSNEAYRRNEKLRMAEGVDEVIYATAIESGIEIREIEGFKFQTDLFLSFNDEIMEAYLTECLMLFKSDNEIAEIGIESLYQMLLAWGNGDYDLMEAILQKDSLTDPMSIALFGDRDIEMYEYTKNLLSKPGQYLIAVGVGHMIGEGGIVKRLENAGYDVNFLYNIPEIETGDIIDEVLEAPLIISIDNAEVRDFNVKTGSPSNFAGIALSVLILTTLITFRIKAIKQ